MTRFPTLLLLCAMPLATAAPLVKPGDKSLPLPGRSFQLDGHDAFIISPGQPHPSKPWVWYAPTLRGLPSKAEVWMFGQFLAKGIAIAGIDVGESYGSPAGRAVYGQFYDLLVDEMDYRPRPVLLARSRGGLMLYGWAAEHPESVGGVAGIYPVCNITSYPGVQRAAGAYGMTPEELEQDLSKHNPIDRLEGLAKAKVPVRHIHGDRDGTVPLEANSGELAKRYRALGGPVELEVVPGRGHDMWNGWFRSQPLTDFIIAHALPAESEKPNPTPKAGATITCRGRLEGGMMAIGGETTGWRLVYLDQAGKPAAIEVDMEAIKEADRFEGREVAITGKVISKNYLERGKVLVLKARTVTPGK